MADEGTVIVDETTEPVEVQIDEKIEPKNVNGPDAGNKMFRLQKERDAAKKLAEERQADIEKITRERDELLAKAQTAEAASQAKAQTDAELLKADILAGLGHSPLLRKFIKATDPAGIKAEIEEITESLGVQKPDAPQAQAQTTTDAPPAEVSRKVTIPAAPAPKRDQERTLDQMTPAEQEKYWADKFNAQFEQ